MYEVPKEGSVKEGEKPERKTKRAKDQKGAALPCSPLEAAVQRLAWDTPCALNMQLGVSHLFTSVGTGKSNLGNQHSQLHSTARTKQFCTSLDQVKYMDSRSLEQGSVNNFFPQCFLLSVEIQSRLRRFIYCRELCMKTDFSLNWSFSSSMYT